MGQSGSSELRITQEASPASSASASATASSSSPPPRPPPQLQWLRASRAGRGSLTAEWHWAERSEPAGRCHLLFLRSDTPQPGQAGRMRRVPVDPRLHGHTMAGLAEDAPYRVCLQCAAALTEAGNRTSSRPMQTMTGRPAEVMHCVNVSTKQAHLPAIIGSCLGALCALILVLALVLLSRRSKQYRKVNERQSSSATTKKVVVHEMAYKTENLPTPKLELDSNSDGYIYDGSEDQQGSSASDDVLTPPPQPPPPPPPIAAAPDDAALVAPAATHQKAATSNALTGSPELESLLADGNQEGDAVDTDAEEATAPPTPPPPPPSMDFEAAAVASASTSVSTSSDGRQVIQVNETDEYSIDLRLCDSLSRQQSLKASVLATTSTGTSVSVTASISTSASVTEAEQPEDSAATPTPPAGNNHQLQLEDQAAVGTVPSLYTQLIETL